MRAIASASSADAGRMRCAVFILWSPCETSIGRAVLVDKDPCTAIDLRELQVVARIFGEVSGGAVPDLEVVGRKRRPVHELMSNPGAGLEAAAIARTQQILLVVQHESGGTGNNVDEFILPGVVMK